MKTLLLGSNYTVQDLISKKLSDTHISNLKPFIFDADVTDPLQVAMQDQQEFLIDKIVEHRGDRKKRTEMEFKVRWFGYDESEDTWEPWKHLRNTSQLHDYLKIHKMKSLISASTKDDTEST
jgi:hypothetical protein